MCRNSGCSCSMSLLHALTGKLLFTIATMLLGTVGLLVDPMLPGSSMALAERASPGLSSAPRNGGLFAIIVGVSRYREQKIPRLDNADKDAQAFGDFLKTQDRIFKDARVVMLTNEKATKSEVEKHLYYTLPRAGKDDTIILFFSGHGAYDPVRPSEYLFLTYDADPEYLGTTAVKMSGLEFLKGIEAERVVIIADACHSGGYTSMKPKVAQSSLQSFLQEVRTSSGTIIITSGKKDQLSWEVPNQKQSVFTHSLIEGLKGKADKDRDGVVTLNEAYEYAYNLTREQSLGRQHPQLEGKVTGAFPLSYVGRAAPAAELKQLLMLAAKKGDVAYMEKLIAAGGDVNARDEDNETPLIRSARNGHLEVVKFLLGRSAEVDARNHARSTALSEASKGGHEKVVGILLAAGADVNSRTFDGLTPLALAVRNGHLATARVLLSAGADVKARTVAGKTPLALAASEGHLEAVKLLVERGSDVEARDLEAATPLIEAARGGRPDVVKFLLDKGARISARSNKPLDNELMRAALLDDLPRVKELLELGAVIDAESDAGDTPLVLAVGLGHSKLIRFLIQKAANVNFRTRGHTTPLLLASRSGRTPVVKALLGGGAYIHAGDADGNNALMVAAGNGHAETVQALMAHQADPNMRNRKSATALMRAAERGDADTVRILLAAGADVNAADSEGDTCLMIGARKGFPAVVKALCRRDADINARNLRGSTALLLAAANGHADLVGFLLARGARPDWRDWEGKTALNAAAEAGQTEVVELLKTKVEDTTSHQN